LLFPIRRDQFQGSLRFGGTVQALVNTLQSRRETVSINALQPRGERFVFQRRRVTSDFGGECPLQGTAGSVVDMFLIDVELRSRRNDEAARRDEKGNEKARR